MRFIIIFSFILHSYIYSNGQATNYRTAVSDVEINSAPSQGLSIIGLSGTHGVAATGAATYAMPIDVLPGIGEMVPTLSLVYNSTSSNGHLGAGWSLTGLSAITIGSKDLHFDSEMMGVDISNSNPYFLDGSRLVALTGVYGANGTTYAIEQHDFSTIQSFGSIQGCNACPDYFQVKTPEGKTLDYGKTTNSKEYHSNGTAVMSYFLERIEDNNSNFIAYSYSIVNGEKVLSEILYTGNAERNIAPFNKIKFHYEQRADKNRLYVGGSSADATVILRENLLTKIEVISGTSTLVKRYDLKYGWNGQHSQLSEIILTGAAGEVANSILFKYGEAEEIVPSISSLHNIYGVGEKAEIFNGDFNGDGLSDILALYYTDTSTGINRPYHTHYKIFHNNGNGNFQLACTNNLPTEQGAGCWTYKPYIFDFLGTGRDEIILARQYDYYEGIVMLLHSFLRIDGNCQTQEVSPALFNFPLTHINNSFAQAKNVHQFVGDFTGNGYKEVLTHLYKGVLTVGNNDSKVQYRGIPSISNVMDVEFEIPFNQPLSHFFRKANAGFTFDFDGDGKDEIALLGQDTLWMIALRQVNGALKAKLLFTQAISHVDLSDVYVGDFNGDRRYDFLVKRTFGVNQWSILYSKGLTNHSQKFEAYNVLIDDPYKALNAQQNKVFVADIDKNGLDDIVIQTPVANGNFNFYPVSNISVYFNAGVKLALVGGVMHNVGFEKRMYNILTDFYRFHSIGDFNGDGQPDFIAIADQLGANNLPFRNYRIEPDNKKQLLTAIRDSYGNVVKFEYSNLAKGLPTYRPSTSTVAFPIMQKPLPFYVVSKISVSDAAAYNEYVYRYEGLLYNNFRKQVLGFTTTFVDDVQTGYTSKTSFALFKLSAFDYKTNVPISNEVYKTNQHPTEIVYSQQSSYTILPVTDGNSTNAKAFWLRLNSTVSKNFVQKTSTLQSWSDYNVISGLPALSNTFVYNNTNASGTALEEVTTQTSFSLMGAPAGRFLPLSMVQSQKRLGADAVQISRNFQYDSKARITHRRIWTGTTKEIAEAFLYDAFGNITRETLSTPSPSEPDRITLFTYSSNGRFLTRKRINNLDFQGHIDFQLYDPKWGKPGRIIDINGQITSITYNNNWGYTQQITDPFQNVSSQTIEWTTEHQAQIKVQQSSSGSVPSTFFYDKEGRVIRKESIGFNNQVSFEHYTYNTRGDLITKTASGANGIPIATHFSYNYDLPNGRLIQSSSELGTTTFQYQYGLGNMTVETTTSYSGWPHAQTNSKTTDVTGKVINSTDQGGALNYTFDSWGNIVRTRLDLDVIQTQKSDPFGRIEELWDINSGTIKFEHNGFGELSKQTDQKNNVTQFTYDRLGRIKTRTINDIDQTTYTYIASGVGKGNISQIIRPAFGTQESFSYDIHGRISSHSKIIQDQAFLFTYQYDPVTGNLAQIQYPSALVINYEYDGKGFLSSISAGQNQKMLLSNPEVNHWGQYSKYTLGQGQFNTINSTTYNNYGQITNIRSLNASGAPINRFNYTFTYNAGTGNMLSRRDHVTNQLETFQYDHLDRLTQFQVGSQPANLFGGWKYCC
jgi:YD repeat-containing protein